MQRLTLKQNVPFNSFIVVADMRDKARLGVTRENISATVSYRAQYTGTSAALYIPFQYRGHSTKWQSCANLNMEDIYISQPRRERTRLAVTADEQGQVDESKSSRTADDMSTLSDNSSKAKE